MPFVEENVPFVKRFKLEMAMVDAKSSVLVLTHGCQPGCIRIKQQSIYRRGMGPSKETGLRY